MGGKSSKVKGAASSGFNGACRVFIDTLAEALGLFRLLDWLSEKIKWGF
jgi:hypothetical protein